MVGLDYPGTCEVRCFALCVNQLSLPSFPSATISGQSPWHHPFSSALLPSVTFRKDITAGSGGAVFNSTDVGCGIKSGLQLRSWQLGSGTVMRYCRPFTLNIDLRAPNREAFIGHNLQQNCRRLSLINILSIKRPRATAITKHLQICNLNYLCPVFFMSLLMLLVTQFCKSSDCQSCHLLLENVSMVHWLAALHRQVKQGSNLIELRMTGGKPKIWFLRWFMKILAEF